MRGVPSLGELPYTSANMPMCNLNAQKEYITLLSQYFSIFFYYCKPDCCNGKRWCKNSDVLNISIINFRNVVMMCAIKHLHNL